LFLAGAVLVLGQGGLRWDSCLPKIRESLPGAKNMYELCHFFRNRFPWLSEEMQYEHTGTNESLTNYIQRLEHLKNFSLHL